MCGARITCIPLTPSMQTKEEKITIDKTARYFTFGNPKNAKNIWFVFHGYGQLAKYFIRNFEHLNPDENYIVAPEGLYRFYLDGFSGRVGATWMTKESRLSDIEDYVRFIDATFETAISLYIKPDSKITALGFSQGVATVSRWVAYGNHKPDRLLLWAGSFPPDLEPAEAKKSFTDLPTLCCVGDSDPFVNEKHIEATRDQLAALDIEAEFLTYSGGHKIPSVEFDRIAREFTA